MPAAVSEVHKLDELLKVIGRCSPPEEAEAAHEHIQEARTYLLGGMPYEYEMSLEMARKSLKRMARTGPRREAEEMLAGLSMN